MNQKRYYSWICAETTSYYNLILNGRGKAFPLIPPELALHSRDSVDSSKPLVEIEQQIQIVIALSQFTVTQGSLIVLAAAPIGKIQYKVNGEAQPAAVRYIASSFRLRPLLAVLGDDCLINQYYVLNSEVLPHGILRQILCRLQVVVWEGAEASYSITEPDIFGKYVARYDLHSGSESVSGMKRRVRYLNLPLYGSGGIGDARVAPEGEIHFTLNKAKGLTQLRANLRTVVKQGSRTVIDDSEKIELTLIHQQRVSEQYRRHIMQLWSKDYRPVAPWENP